MAENYLISPADKLQSRDKLKKTILQISNEYVVQNCTRMHKCTCEYLLHVLEALEQSVVEVGRHVTFQLFNLIRRDTRALTKIKLFSAPGLVEMFVTG